MRYKLLGRSGLRVSELCLGTMTFGEEWGWGSSKDESRQILDAFLEAGGNFIDTANVYTNGTSETLLGEFLKGHRDRAVLATKYTNSMPGTDPNAGGNQRKNMMRSVEASLRRLQTDYIDLYWLHIWDRITPELPRAPFSAPADRAIAVLTTSADFASVLASASAERMVNSMFAPVSESATGNTLRRLISSM